MFHHLAIFLVTLLACASSARAVTIAWSPVGNPGNAPDVFSSVYAGGFINAGAVPYAFSISTYDVTTSQYVEFLNAKDPTGANALGLYNAVPIAGPPHLLTDVSFNASNPDGSKYAPIAGRENWPAEYLTWYDAVRFANWLSNGQGNGDTETGAYTLLGGTPTPSNGATITRNPGATIALPSADEWYKAAYYNPATNSYFAYPTGSNSPIAGSGPTALPNHANYSGFELLNSDGHFYGQGLGTPTPVGAYSGTTSPSGAYDMAGDVWQWIETAVGNNSRYIRGGAYYSSLLETSSAFTQQPAAHPDIAGGGFRLVSITNVPEPSTAVLAIVAGIALGCLRLRTGKLPSLHGK